VRTAALVLCYHAISSSWEHELAVPLETLEAQLEHLLAQGFQPAEAGEAVRGSRRLLHVTFDDALRSVLHAVPVLERLEVPATVFACTAFADEGRPFAVPELRAELAAHLEEFATMGWPELRELAERGFEIGSHTLSHPWLTTLSDDALLRELVESRRQIEDELGRRCRFLAYPYGDHDLRVRRAVRAAGYEAAFALPASRRWGDPFQVARVGVWRGDRAAEFALKTSGLMRTPVGIGVVRAVTRMRRSWRASRAEPTVGSAEREVL
jgi:peptidoglycan/xylan/chitin deacetylase (PgdA/CDA1 family)